MPQKTLPFTLDQIEKIEKKYPTPFHLYDESGIRANARRLKEAFAWNPGFKEYFAVKACPNPFLMKILKQEGFGMDCSSLPELLLSEEIGVTGESIMFTSNDTPAGEFVKAKALGAVINLDDITHIPFLEQSAGLPELVCFRYNPGPLYFRLIYTICAFNGISLVVHHAASFKEAGNTILGVKIEIMCSESVSLLVYKLNKRSAHLRKRAVCDIVYSVTVESRPLLNNLNIAHCIHNVLFNIPDCRVA
jgi:hypothetical protein